MKSEVVEEKQRNTDEDWSLFNGWLVFMAVVVAGCKLLSVLG